MGLPQINYNPGGGAVVIYFQDGPQNFIPEDSGRVNDNVATSGLKERIFEKTDILISFTMPALAIGSTYDDWKNFYAWAIGGGSFIFAPNPGVTVAAAPWSGAAYYVNCVLEDSAFRPKRVGMLRYALNCKFRVIPDAYCPPSSGWILNAFYGRTPS